MIDPRGLSGVVEWSDLITMPLNDIGVYPRRLDRADAWVDWAFDLMQSPKLYNFVLADPRGFTDWVEWAARFNQVVAYR